MTGKEVLRAIADGADPSEFEASRNGMWWGALPELKIGEVTEDVGYSFRRKPRTRVVNGFTVPVPIQEMPKDGRRLYMALPGGEDWHVEVTFHGEDNYHNKYLSRGLLFSTKEAAIANAKAMCGIDPNGDA